jgi:hypothetical protein
MECSKLNVIKIYQVIVEVFRFFDDCINENIIPYKKQKSEQDCLKKVRFYAFDF